MDILLILIIVAAAVMVLVALARGLYYFSRGYQAGQDGTSQDNLKMQNNMMMARVKWQAITVILLILIGVLALGR